MQGTINYVSPNRVPVPVGDTTGSDTIAQWLGSDIQYSTSTVEEWRNIFIALTLKKSNAGYQGTGNSISVFANSLLVLLESEYSENNKVCLTIEQLLIVLDSYRDFLISKGKDGSYVLHPIEVEYLAEGEHARDYYLDHGGSLQTA